MSFFFLDVLLELFYFNQQKNREPADPPYLYRSSEAGAHVLRSVPVFWSSLDLD